MALLVNLKVAQHEAVREVPMSTGDAVLQEGPTQDTYWGLDRSGRGTNHLGNIFMRIRAGIRASQIADANAPALAASTLTTGCPSSRDGSHAALVRPSARFIDGASGSSKRPRTTSSPPVASSVDAQPAAHGPHNRIVGPPDVDAHARSDITHLAES